ncbi:MAG: hypothetical protein ACXWU8_07100, partial [Rhodoplanes sp.]
MLNNGGILVREGVVIARDRPGAPVRILEVGPTGQTVAVVDDDVGDRLDTIGEQRFEHRAMGAGIAVA